MKLASLAWCLLAVSLAGAYKLHVPVDITSRASRANHVLSAVAPESPTCEDEGVWKVTMEGEDAPPLGAMPLFGVGRQRYSLAQAPSPGAMCPLSVDDDELPGVFEIRNVLSPKECEALIDLSEQIGYAEFRRTRTHRYNLQSNQVLPK